MAPSAALWAGGTVAIAAVIGKLTSHARLPSVGKHRPADISAGSSESSESEDTEEDSSEMDPSDSGVREDGEEEEPGSLTAYYLALLPQQQQDELLDAVSDPVHKIRLSLEVRKYVATPYAVYTGSQSLDRAEPAPLERHESASQAAHHAQDSSAVLAAAGEATPAYVRSRDEGGHGGAGQAVGVLPPGAPAGGGAALRASDLVDLEEAEEADKFREALDKVTAWDDEGAGSEPSKEEWSAAGGGPITSCGSGSDAVSDVGGCAAVAGDAHLRRTDVLLPAPLPHMEGGQDPALQALRVDAVKAKELTPPAAASAAPSAGPAAALMLPDDDDGDSEALVSLRGAPHVDRPADARPPLPAYSNNSQASHCSKRTGGHAAPPPTSAAVGDAAVADLPLAVAPGDAQASEQQANHPAAQQAAVDSAAATVYPVAQDEPLAGDAPLGRSPRACVSRGPTFSRLDLVVPTLAAAPHSSASEAADPAQGAQQGSAVPALVQLRPLPLSSLPPAWPLPGAPRPSPREAAAPADDAESADVPMFEGGMNSNRHAAELRRQIAALKHTLSSRSSMCSDGSSSANGAAAAVAATAAGGCWSPPSRASSLVDAALARATLVSQQAQEMANGTLTTAMLPVARTAVVPSEAGTAATAQQPAAGLVVAMVAAAGAAAALLSPFEESVAEAELPGGAEAVAAAGGEVVQSSDGSFTFRNSGSSVGPRVLPSANAGPAGLPEDAEQLRPTPLPSAPLPLLPRLELSLNEAGGHTGSVPEREAAAAISAPLVPPSSVAASPEQVAQAKLHALREQALTVLRGNTGTAPSSPAATAASRHSGTRSASLGAAASAASNTRADGGGVGDVFAQAEALVQALRLQQQQQQKQQTPPPSSPPSQPPVLSHYYAVDYPNAAEAAAEALAGGAPALAWPGLSTPPPPPRLTATPSDAEATLSRLQAQARAMLLSPAAAAAQLGVPAAAAAAAAAPRTPSLLPVPLTPAAAAAPLSADAALSALQARARSMLARSPTAAAATAAAHGAAGDIIFRQRAASMQAVTQPRSWTAADI